MPDLSDLHSGLGRPPHERGETLMIFNTFGYFFLFLIPAAFGFRCVPPRGRAVVCVVFGSLFFVWFSVTTVGGWLGAACLGFFLWESVISRWYQPGSRWCWAGVVLALAILGVFKYWNFAVGNLPSPWADQWHWGGAFLPLGISFFTFEFIHYAQDRRAGRTETGTFWEYLAFILFFPTMVAGPIKRYQDFLPALRSPSLDWPQDVARGVTRILAGLAKKFALADFLTALTHHLNSTDIAVAPRWILPVWLLAYGGMIYFDFSAYSDIAIGSSRLFGLSVKENFDWPYLRTNIADFWRHWHMSLTRWLTDYVFVPLGGSRSGLPRVCGNVLVTFLVSGLWHGAGWNFLAWGAWHGFLLIVHRVWKVFRGNDSPPSAVGSVAAWALTFVCVQIGWAFFAMDLPTAGLFFRRLVFG